MMRLIYNLDVWDMFVWKTESRPLLFLKESMQDEEGGNYSRTSIFLGSDPVEVKKAIPQDLLWEHGENVTAPVINLIDGANPTTIVSINGNQMTVNNVMSVSLPRHYSPSFVAHGVVVLSKYPDYKYYDIHLGREVQTAIHSGYVNGKMVVYMSSKWYGVKSTTYNQKRFLAEQDIVVLNVTGITEFDAIVATYTRPDFYDEAYQEKFVWSG